MIVCSQDKDIYKVRTLHKHGRGKQQTSYTVCTITT